MTVSDKKKLLEDNLKSMGRIVVAFSAGVDSTYLLMTAREVLGENATALLVRSCLIPDSEICEAESFCREQGIELITLDYDPLAMEEFCDNPKERCYICKKVLFSLILKKAEEIGADTVAEGTNADDEFDYRPGMKALKELGIRSPLKEAGLTKEEIRKLTEAAGLNTWNKPAFACLATRIPQGDRITAEGLLRIEKAEDFLKSLGLKQYRVRTHGDLARIEVIPQDMGYIMRDDVRLCIDARFRELGYRYVSVDIRGYRTGNMNRPS